MIFFPQKKDLQPWANLIAAGTKTIETRLWATAYRGEPPVAARHLLYRARGNGWKAKEFSPVQHSGTHAIVRLHRNGA
mgnify:CR=1 FL=1|jgi:kynurenine formamidase